MRSSFIFKLLLSVVLSVSITFNPIIVNATVSNSLTSMPSPKHKQTIQGFVSELNIIQRRIYDIAQSSLVDQPRDVTAIIQAINNDLDTLNRRIEAYLQTVPSFSEENREVLLVFNAFNFIKDGLYTLSLLNNASSNVERTQLLDTYFNARLSAIDTIEFLEALLSRY